MLISFYDSSSGASFPLHAITSIGREMDHGDGKAQYREVRVGDGRTAFRLYGLQYNNLMARPAQLIPSEPGCRLIRAEDGQSWSEPLIAWALCLDGEVRPVTANGVLGGSSPTVHSWVQMPDGSVQAVGEYTEPCGFDSVAEMVAHFTPKTDEPDPWPKAEVALREALAALAASSDDEGEVAALADARTQCELALLALPSRTAAHAFRKLEIALADDGLGRDDIDFPALIDEAKRLAVQS